MTPLLTIGTALLLALLVTMYLRRNRVRSEEEIRQDILKQLFHLAEKGKTPTVESLSGALHLRQDEVARLIRTLGDEGYLSIGEERLSLTDEGRTAALRTIRSHRLWERHLADETGVQESRWHVEAEKQEHKLTPAETDALSRRLGHPLYDPHGDPIPQEDLKLPRPRGVSIATASPGEEFVVVHLEDEPAVVYNELLEKGIHRGSRVRFIGKDQSNADLLIDGGSQSVSLLAAANITVLPSRVRDPLPVTGRTLQDLRPGMSGTVVSLSPSCLGMQRRRMLDLGILPGTVISAELVSPAGDPTAYRIRGALVALRRHEAALVNVELRAVRSEK
jgi:DtxR family Mn-dependent transcriptional regulator